MQRDQRDRFDAPLELVHVGDEGDILKEAGEIATFLADGVFVLVP